MSEERGGSGTRPPRSVRVSIVLWWTTALLLLAQLIMLWLGSGELGQLLVRQGTVAPEAAVDQAWRLLWMNTGFAVFFAVAYLVLGGLLFRRRPWARITLTVFAVLHLVLLLGTGAVLGPQVVLVLLGAVATVLLWIPASTNWVAGEHD